MKRWLRLFVLAAVFAAAVVGLPGAGIGAALARPLGVSANCVTLHQNVNGGGWKKEHCGSAEHRQGSMGSGYNDEISSVYTGDRRVLLFSEANFGGACLDVKPWTSYDALSAIRVNWRVTWNDITSSYIVNPSRNC